MEPKKESNIGQQMAHGRRNASLMSWTKNLTQNSLHVELIHGRMHIGRHRDLFVPTFQRQRANAADQNVDSECFAITSRYADVCNYRYVYNEELKTSCYEPTVSFPISCLIGQPALACSPTESHTDGAKMVLVPDTSQSNELKEHIQITIKEEQSRTNAGLSDRNGAGEWRTSRSPKTDVSHKLMNTDVACEHDATRYSANKTECKHPLSDKNSPDDHILSSESDEVQRWKPGDAILKEGDYTRAEVKSEQQLDNLSWRFKTEVAIEQAQFRFHMKQASGKMESTCPESAAHQTTDGLQVHDTIQIECQYTHVEDETERLEEAKDDVRPTVVVSQVIPTTMHDDQRSVEPTDQNTVMDGGLSFQSNRNPMHGRPMSYTEHQRKLEDAKSAREKITSEHQLNVSLETTHAVSSAPSEERKEVEQRSQRKENKNTYQMHLNAKFRVRSVYWTVQRGADGRPETTERCSVRAKYHCDLKELPSACSETSNEGPKKPSEIHDEMSVHQDKGEREAMEIGDDRQHNATTQAHERQAPKLQKPVEPIILSQPILQAVANICVFNSGLTDTLSSSIRLIDTSAVASEPIASPQEGHTPVHTPDNAYTTQLTGSSLAFQMPCGTPSGALSPVWNWSSQDREDSNEVLRESPSPVYSSFTKNQVTDWALHNPSSSGGNNPSPDHVTRLDQSSVTKRQLASDRITPEPIQTSWNTISQHIEVGLPKEQYAVRTTVGEREPVDSDAFSVLRTHIDQGTKQHKVTIMQHIIPTEPAGTIKFALSVVQTEQPVFSVIDTGVLCSEQELSVLNNERKQVFEQKKPIQAAALEHPVLQAVMNISVHSSKISEPVGSPRAPTAQSVESNFTERVQSPLSHKSDDSISARLTEPPSPTAVTVFRMPHQGGLVCPTVSDEGGAHCDQDLKFTSENRPPEITDCECSLFAPTGRIPLAPVMRPFDDYTHKIRISYSMTSRAASPSEQPDLCFRQQIIGQLKFTQGYPSVIIQTKSDSALISSSVDKNQEPILEVEHPATTTQDAEKLQSALSRAQRFSTSNLYSPDSEEKTHAIPSPAFSRTSTASQRTPKEMDNNFPISGGEIHPETVQPSFENEERKSKHRFSFFKSLSPARVVTTNKSERKSKSLIPLFPRLSRSEWSSISLGSSPRRTKRNFEFGSAYERRKWSLASENPGHVSRMLSRSTTKQVSISDADAKGREVKQLVVSEFELLESELKIPAGNLCALQNVATMYASEDAMRRQSRRFSLPLKESKSAPTVSGRKESVSGGKPETFVSEGRGSMLTRRNSNTWRKWRTHRPSIGSKSGKPSKTKKYDTETRDPCEPDSESEKSATAVQLADKSVETINSSSGDPVITYCSLKFENAAFTSVAELTGPSAWYITPQVRLQGPHTTQDGCPCCSKEMRGPQPFAWNGENICKMRPLSQDITVRLLTIPDVNQRQVHECVDYNNPIRCKRQCASSVGEQRWLIVCSLSDGVLLECGKLPSDAEVQCTITVVHGPATTEYATPSVEFSLCTPKMVTVTKIPVLSAQVVSTWNRVPGSAVSGTNLQRPECTQLHPLAKQVDRTVPLRGQDAGFKETTSLPHFHPSADWVNTVQKERRGESMTEWGVQHAPRHYRVNDKLEYDQARATPITDTTGQGFSSACMVLTAESSGSWLPTNKFRCNHTEPVDFEDIASRRWPTGLVRHGLSGDEHTRTYMYPEGVFDKAEIKWSNTVPCGPCKGVFNRGPICASEWAEAARCINHTAGNEHSYCECNFHEPARWQHRLAECPLNPSSPDYHSRCTAQLDSRAHCTMLESDRSRWGNTYRMASQCRPTLSCRCSPVHTIGQRRTLPPQTYSPKFGPNCGRHRSASPQLIHPEMRSASHCAEFHITQMHHTSGPRHVEVSPSGGARCPLDSTLRRVGHNPELHNSPYPHVNEFGFNVIFTAPKLLEQVARDNECPR
ncbi:unnamed protein product [Dicrocoelium dendriticum]|nr:unnamed protein product [Dicrocoelium dendriticum]